MKNKKDLTLLMNTRDSDYENQYRHLLAEYVEKIQSSPDGWHDVVFSLTRWDDDCREFIFSDIKSALPAYSIVLDGIQKELRIA